VLALALLDELPPAVAAFAGPMEPPWTTLGATVLAFAAAAWYSAIVAEPSDLQFSHQQWFCEIGRKEEKILTED